MAENPRKLLYLSVHDKLSVLITEKIIRNVGRFNSQFGNEEREAALRTPSVLIQIANKLKGTTASTYQLQEGWIYITCHYGINVAKIDIGTQDFVIAQGIYEKLQGECGITDEEFIHTTPLDRMDDIEDSDYDGLYHGQVIFKTYFKDLTKCDAVETQSVQLTDINGTINGKLEI